MMTCISLYLSCDRDPEGIRQRIPFGKLADTFWVNLFQNLSYRVLFGYPFSEFKLAGTFRILSGPLSGNFFQSLSYRVPFGYPFSELKLAGTFRILSGNLSGNIFSEFKLAGTFRVAFFLVECFGTLLDHQWDPSGYQLLDIRKGSASGHFRVTSKSLPDRYRVVTRQLAGSHRKSFFFTMGGEHKQINITEIKFEKSYFVSKWRPKQCL